MSRREWWQISKHHRALRDALEAAGLCVVDARHRGHIVLTVARVGADKAALITFPSSPKCKELAVISAVRDALRLISQQEGYKDG